MSEPLIPNPIPVVIPAKTYDKQYLTHTSIIAKPNQPWDVIINSVSYDGDSSILNDNFSIMLKDVKACAALVPQMAEAMNKMIEALGLISVAAKAANTKVITPQNIVATLAAVQGGE
jgi:hypothetical protein